MFGSSKNTIKTPTHVLQERLTGLERAKLERANEPPRPPSVADIFEPNAAAVPAVETKPTVKTREAQMPDKPKPTAPQESAHLYVGVGVKLKGEVFGCDMLRVEGTFEGTAQARQLVLCAGGAFLGTAQIDEAELEGSFDGTLHVRGRLFLRNKGLIVGNFSYGQLEIERGGQIDGQVTPFEKRATDKERVETKPAAGVAAMVARPVPQAVAPVPSVRPAAPTVHAAALPLTKPAVAAPAPRPAAPAQTLNGTQPPAGQPSPVPAE
jgi:cytoskeletal protein CcmA (bactofilin family)